MERKFHCSIHVSVVAQFSWNIASQPGEWFTPG